MSKLKIQDEPVVDSLLVTKRVAALTCSMSERTLQANTFPRGDLMPVWLPTGGLRYSRDEIKRWIAKHQAGAAE